MHKTKCLSPISGDFPLLFSNFGGIKIGRIISVILIGVLFVTGGTFVFTKEVEAGSYQEAIVQLNDNPFFIDGDSGEASENAIPVSDINTAKKQVLNDNLLTAQDKKQIIEKLSILENEAVSNSSECISPLAITNPSGLLGVKVFTQENGYFCGPATVKQTLTYINGSAASQSTIAEAIGTTSAGSVLANMVKLYSPVIRFELYPLMS